MPQFEKAAQVVVPHVYRLQYTCPNAGPGMFDILIQVAPEVYPSVAYCQAWLDAEMDMPCRAYPPDPVLVWDIRQK